MPLACSQALRDKEKTCARSGHNCAGPKLRGDSKTTSAFQLGEQSLLLLRGAAESAELGRKCAVPGIMNCEQQMVNCYRGHG